MNSFSNHPPRVMDHLLRNRYNEKLIIQEYAYDWQPERKAQS